MFERATVWVRWFGLGRLIAAAVSVVVVLAGGWWLVHPPDVPVEASLPRAGTASIVPATVAGAAAARGSTPVALVVHVAGAVHHPGVYTVPPGARIVDAIALAGGALADAATDAVNLAELVVDGERVLVPKVGEVVAEPQSRSAVAAGPLNLNTATAEQLDELPGVGPATAAAIVAFRQANGPFARVDDLARVRGIGPAKLDALRQLIRT